MGSLQPGDANFYFNRGNTLLAMKEARCRAAWTQITPPYSEYRVWGSDYPCEYSEYRVPQESLALRDLELAVGNDVRVALDRWSTAALVVEEYGRTLVHAQQAIVAQQQLRQIFMLIGQFELLLAKQQEYDAWQAYLEAIRDYWIARTDLERAIGSALPGAPRPGAPVVGPQDLPGMPADPDLDRRGQSPEEPHS